MKTNLLIALIIILSVKPVFSYTEEFAKRHNFTQESRQTQASRDEHLKEAEDSQKEADYFYAHGKTREGFQWQFRADEHTVFATKGTPETDLQKREKLREKRMARHMDELKKIGKLP